MADPIYTSASPIAVNPADGELIGGAVFTAGSGWVKRVDLGSAF